MSSPAAAPKQEKWLVFVYGTLKRGHGNHHILAKSTFVCPAITVPKKYKLYNLGAFPGLGESDKGLAIKGEIYEIDQKTLSRCDSLEGVPFLYVRKTIEIATELPGELKGKTVEAYFYNRNLAGYEDCGEEWGR